MHPDKKREEQQQKREFEELQQSEIFESEDFKEAEIEKEEETTEMRKESPEDLEKKKKRDAIFEMALFLILGILVGVTIKTEAIKRITIGFNDYQIIPSENRYDIEALKKNLEQKMKEQAAAQEALQNQAPDQVGQPAVK